MADAPKLAASFFKTATGTEPVREWLRGLARDERRAIGVGIAYVQYKWPLGRPHVGYIESGIWELRCRLPKRIARVLFAIDGEEMVLLHGFVKKTQAIPVREIEVARGRWRDWQRARR